MKKYIIKPLVWEEVIIGDKKFISHYTSLGMLGIMENNGRVMWGYNLNNTYGCNNEWHDCSSIDEAKQLVEQYWTSFLANLLQEVE